MIRFLGVFCGMVLLTSCAAMGGGPAAAAETEKTSSSELRDAVVKIECVQSMPNYFIPWQNKIQEQFVGTGVVIAGNRILTNAHNVADATFVTVRRQNDDTLFIAEVAFIDHECDLALLNVAEKSFFDGITPCSFAETPPPQTPVLAIGFPVGGDGLSVTQGIISRIEVRQYAHSLRSLLTAQIDAAINPGNSGGPIFYDGKVVGIAFQGDRSGENLGYMIPEEIIRHFLKDIEDGKVDGFGSLGVRSETLDNPDTRRYLKMTPEQTGVRLNRVSPSMPSGTLLNNDVLLEIDGFRIANNGNIRLSGGAPRQWGTVVDGKQVGEPVRLNILRDGKVLELTIPVRKPKDLVHPPLYDRLPDYYVVGGLIFTNLSYSFLWEWEDGNPPESLRKLVDEEPTLDGEEVVVLSMILGDEVNMGYIDLASMRLLEVDGRKVHNLKELIEVVESSRKEFITFEFEDDCSITLDREKMRSATPRILKRYRVPADRSDSLR